MMVVVLIKNIVCMEYFPPGLHVSNHMKVIKLEQYLNRP